jgi:putative ABC transport system permease protein
MITDYIKLAIENISHRRLRAWLTILGIVVGIAAVVALVSLGKGLQYTVDQQFSKVGGDMVTVQIKNIMGISSATATLTEDDYKVVSKSDGVEGAVRALTGIAKIEYNKKTKYSSIRGMPTDETSKIYNSISMYDVEYGRALKSGDKNKVVIGPEFAKEKNFGREIQLNDKLTINDKEFTVIGIFKTGNNPGISQAVIMSLDDIRELFNEPNTVSLIMVKVKDAKNIDNTIDNIKKDLRRHRGLKEGQEDFTVQSTKSFIESFLVIFNVVTVLLVGLASISLLVGAVGIANTMYTAVLERRKEIGVMKAIGARNNQIMTVFLIESSVIGLIGGVIGVILGTGMGLIAKQIIGIYLGPGFFQIFLPWWLLVGAAMFALVIGTLSGILPAKQAAEMHPVDALRS